MTLLDFIDVVHQLLQVLYGLARFALGQFHDGFGQDAQLPAVTGRFGDDIGLNLLVAGKIEFQLG